MLALAAAIVFGLAFLLNLIGVAITAKISLIYLGLTLLALHLAIGSSYPVSMGRRGRR
ncbi:MAG: hypothetical protein WCB04_02555 [Mycobacteriales bacterium]